MTIREQYQKETGWLFFEQSNSTSMGYIRWLEEKVTAKNNYAKCPKCGDRLQISCTNAGCDFIKDVTKHIIV